jgi:hypothetical protein
MRRLAPCSTPQRSCGASQAYRPTLQSGDTDCVAVWPPAKRSVPAPPGFLPLAGSRTILTTNPYSASFRWTRVNCWTNKSGQDQHSRDTSVLTLSGGTRCEGMIIGSPLMQRGNGIAEVRVGIESLYAAIFDECRERRGAFATSG